MGLPAAHEAADGSVLARRLRAADRWLDGRRAVVFGVLIAVALAARLAYAWFAVSPQLTDDETSFWAIAGNVAAGEGFTYAGTPTAWRPPAYTGLIGMLRVAGAGVRAVQVFQAALGAVTVLALLDLARRVRVPRWAAVGAAAVAAVYPPFVHLSSQVLSENLSLPMLVIAMSASARLADDIASGAVATQRLLARAALTGMLWGVGLLARPALLPALGVVGLVLLLGRGAPVGRRVAVAAALGAAAVVVVLPWTLRNAATVGGPVPVVSNEGFTLWVANRADAEGVKDVFRDPAYPGLEDYAVYGEAFPGVLDEAAADGFDFAAALEGEQDDWFREQARAAIVGDPLRFLRRTALKVVLALEPAPDNASREEATSRAAAVVLWMTSGPVLVAGSLGLVVLVRRRGRAGALLAGAAVAGLVGMAVHLPYVRYRVGVVDPFLLVGAAALLAALAGALPRDDAEPARASAPGP